MSISFFIPAAISLGLLWMMPILSAKGAFARYTFASKPSLLPVRKREDGDEVEYVSLRTLLGTKCPSLFLRYTPLWWLPNGHLQTLYCVMADFASEDQVWYKRTYLRLADGGTIGLDFTPTEGDLVEPNAPIIVVQHGLSGGSYEPYIRAILKQACTPTSKGGLGYRAVVINFRGCAAVPLTSPLFYSAGGTDDTRQALMYIAHLYPDAPLLGLGFSLGANILTKYLAEEGGRSRLQSACVLACPWDMKRNGDSLDGYFLGRNLWSRGMGTNMQNLIKRHTAALLIDPTSAVAKATRDALDLRYPRLNIFDNTFTRITGGTSLPFPFKDAAEYYIWAATHNDLTHIKVPFLAINSADDPVVKHVPTDCADNGLVVLGLTEHGGHLGWFQSPKSSDRWTTKPVLEWLKLMGKDFVWSPRPSGASIDISEDGFLRDQENPSLGCKVLPGGDLINGNAGDQKTFQGL